MYKCLRSLANTHEMNDIYVVFFVKCVKFHQLFGTILNINKKF